MNPILFESTAKSFNNNGIGILSDAAFCEVTEERNGIFELVLNYPISGIHFSEIGQRSIILAKPNATAEPQPFRIYKITKPMNGMVTVYAEHISYDLSGVAVVPFEAGSASAALQALKSNSVGENLFEFWTDKSTVATMNVKTPASVRAMLGGVTGSVLDTYGGEYEWDGFTVKLHNQRGQNRGVSVRYGKNLIDLTQEENCASVYTAVMPFWADSEGNTVMLDEKTVEVEGNFDFVRAFVLDLSSEFENQPTEEEIKSYTEKYIKNNKIGVPHVSMNLSFVQLEQTEEYKNKALLGRVNLCDEVNVVFEKLGISATAQVIKTVYNVLLNRYESVELGDAKSNIADTIVKQEQAIKDAPKQAMSMVAKAAENATQLITGNRGGYVVIHSSTGASEPDEILIMDKPTIEEAVKVWRWNNSGLGYSENGYPGPYTSAWTIDGAFNADFITAGTISANLIKSGLLQSFNGRTTFDMDDGTITVKQSNSFLEITDKGLEFYVIFNDDGVQRRKSFIKMSTLEPSGDLDLLIGSLETEKIRATNSFALKNTDTNIECASLDFYNDSGRLRLADADGNDLIILSRENSIRNIRIYDPNGNLGMRQMVDASTRIVDLYDTRNNAGAQLAMNDSISQLVLAQNGEIKAMLKADGNGGYLLLGGSDESWAVAWNDGESHLRADHHHFLNKSEGLFVEIDSNIDFSYSNGSTLNFDGNGYSAIVLCGWPGGQDYSSKTSIVIPVGAIRVGNSSSYSSGAIWQIADDNYYLAFNVYRNSSGRIYMAAKAGDGHITEIYGIR